MDTRSAQVLVVGGSLVGLSTALFLRRQGVDVVLVEKHPGTSVHPRTPGYNARTVELFRAEGVEDSVRAAGPWRLTGTGLLWAETLASDNYHWITPQGWRESQRGLVEVSPSDWAVLAQDKLEPILRTHAEQRGADLRFGTELISFTSDADGVSAETVHRETGRRCAIRASYLVAADGADSPIRAQLGIGQDGLGVLEHSIGIMVRADVREVLRDRSFAICQVENAGVSAMIRVVGDLLSLNVRYRPDQGEQAQHFTTERCVELTRAAVGLSDLAVEIVDVSPWHTSAAVAQRFSVGRVFLAGDAAHVMPPSGAFGANTGIQDAWNLAWKLGFVLNGWAGASLLDTYESERRPVAERTVDQALVRGRAWFDADYDYDGDYVDDVTVSFGYRYGADFENPQEPSGTPGARMPHLWLERDTQPVSTVDLWNPGLLLLTGSGDDSVPDAASVVSRRYGLPMSAYRVGGKSGLRDSEGRWTELFGNATVLVRPDGFVLWRAEDMDDPAERLNDVIRDSLQPTGEVTAYASATAR